MTAIEAAEKWGISREWVGVLARQGRIDGAKKVSKYWLIPENAPNPTIEKQKKPEIGSEDFIFPCVLCLTNEQTKDLSNFSEDERQLYQAQLLVLGCRFEEGYALLMDILSRPQKLIIKVFALYFVCMAQTYLGNLQMFRDALFEMNLIISTEFPHQKELSYLSADIESFFSGNEAFMEDERFDTSYSYSKEVFPYMTLISAYKMMLSKLVSSQPQNPIPFEIACQWMEKEDYLLSAQVLHLYLGLYYLVGREMDKSQNHLCHVLELGRTTKSYLYVAVYYEFYTAFLDSILCQLPDQEERNVRSLLADYGRHYQQFTNSVRGYSLLLRLTDADYNLIYYAFEGKSAKEIAEELNISFNNVRKRYTYLYQKLGVANKAELVAFYKKTVSSY